MFHPFDASKGCPFPCVLFYIFCLSLLSSSFLHSPLFSLFFYLSFLINLSFSFIYEYFALLFLHRRSMFHVLFFITFQHSFWYFTFYYPFSLFLSTGASFPYFYSCFSAFFFITLNTILWFMSPPCYFHLFFIDKKDYLQETFYCFISKFRRYSLVY